jgi:hypothetical protein
MTCVVPEVMVAAVNLNAKLAAVEESLRLLDRDLRVVMVVLLTFAILRGVLWTRRAEPKEWRSGAWRDPE